MQQPTVCSLPSNQTRGSSQSIAKAKATDPVTIAAR